MESSNLRSSLKESPQLNINEEKNKLTSSNIVYNDAIKDKLLNKKSKRKHSKNEYIETFSKSEIESLNYIFDRPNKITSHENNEVETEVEYIYLTI
jgi:hypothetical protein